jgi:hypothetical protein
MVYVLSYTVQSPILQKPCKYVAVLISRCASDLGYPNLHLTSNASPAATAAEMLCVDEHCDDSSG